VLVVVVVVVVLGRHSGGQELGSKSKQLGCSHPPSKLTQKSTVHGSLSVQSRGVPPEQQLSTHCTLVRHGSQSPAVWQVGHTGRAFGAETASASVRTMHTASVFIRLSPRRSCRSRSPDASLSSANAARTLTRSLRGRLLISISFSDARIRAR